MTVLMGCGPTGPSKPGTKTEPTRSTFNFVLDGKSTSGTVAEGETSVRPTAINIQRINGFGIQAQLVASPTIDFVFLANRAAIDPLKVGSYPLMPGGDHNVDVSFTDIMTGDAETYGSTGCSSHPGLAKLDSTLTIQNIKTLSAGVKEVSGKMTGSLYNLTKCKATDPVVTVSYAVDFVIATVGVGSDVDGSLP